MDIYIYICVYWNERSEDGGEVEASIVTLQIARYFSNASGKTGKKRCYQRGFRSSSSKEARRRENVTTSATSFLRDESPFFQLLLVTMVA